MLEIRDVRHAYHGRTVLTIDRLTVPDGAAVALVGANGAGKSTLLRILAGLEQPLSGTVELDGVPAGPALRRRVTLVEQRPVLFRGTVSENIAFGLRARRFDRVARQARVRETARTLGVEHLLERPISRLSEGEVQRVAVARAWAVRPDVLLLDEPLSSADRSATTLLFHALASERQKRGLTVCLASHRLEEAYRWTTDVRALLEGRISSMTPENLFRAELAGDDELKCAGVGEVQLAVLTPHRGSAILAISPADIVVSRQRLDSSARNSLAGRVLRVEEHAAGGVSLTVDVGVELTARLSHMALRELGLAPGDEAVVSFKASAVQVF